MGCSGYVELASGWFRDISHHLAPWGSGGWFHNDRPFEGLVYTPLCDRVTLQGGSYGFESDDSLVAY